MGLGKSYDVVVVGSGPNGLSAAITVARAGRSVLVVEAKDQIGGGARSEDLTLPGYHHDFCSAVYPMTATSPFFRSLPLEEHGLSWVHSPACLAHPFDDGTAAMLYPSLEETAATLGEDGEAYRKLMEPFVKRWGLLFDDFMGPLRMPRHPALLTSFGLNAIRSADGLARAKFRDRAARGLFAGLAAHSMLPLTQSLSAAIGLVLAIAGHARGWPLPRGGAQQLTEALASYLRSLGGVIQTGVEIRRPEDLGDAKSVIFDVGPRTLAAIGESHFPKRFVRALRKVRLGPSVFKLDWALSGPIPWKAAVCAEAATVHLGGDLEEMILAEAAPWRGKTAERPYVLLAQPTLFDPSRAPEGGHIAWAYCHIPHGSDGNATEAIENQIERFAPGFRQRIKARCVTTPRDFEAHNANLFRGDITGGISDWRQVFFRPTLRANPYSTPVANWFLGSAATPPGPGVHGMCGYFAARALLNKDL